MYIDDLLDALPIIIQKGDHTPVNIGNPNKCTVNDIKRWVQAIIGQQTDSTYTKYMENDPTRRYPDISKILDMGWRPKVNLEEGLKQTILFFKEMNHD